MLCFASLTDADEIFKNLLIEFNDFFIIVKTIGTHRRHGIRRGRVPLLQNHAYQSLLDGPVQRGRQPA